MREWLACLNSSATWSKLPRNKWKLCLLLLMTVVWLGHLICESREGKKTCGEAIQGEALVYQMSRQPTVLALNCNLHNMCLRKEMGTTVRRNWKLVGRLLLWTIFSQNPFRDSMEDASRDMKGEGGQLRVPAFFYLIGLSLRGKKKWRKRERKTEMPEQRISHLKPEDMNLSLNWQF